jgi:hypothetical protein
MYRHITHNTGHTHTYTTQLHMHRHKTHTHIHGHNLWNKTCEIFRKQSTYEMFKNSIHIQVNWFDTPAIYPSEHTSFTNGKTLHKLRGGDRTWRNEYLQCLCDNIHVLYSVWIFNRKFRFFKTCLSAYRSWLFHIIITFFLGSLWFVWESN